MLSTAIFLNKDPLQGKVPERSANRTAETIEKKKSNKYISFVIKDLIAIRMIFK